MLQARGVRSLPQTCGLPDPGSFAVVGAAAFMSGSGSIVLFVIALLVEITGDISSILPIAVAAVTGRFVARTFIGRAWCYGYRVWYRLVGGVWDGMGDK